MIKHKLHIVIIILHIEHTFPKNDNKFINAYFSMAWMALAYYSIIGRLSVEFMIKIISVIF